MDGIVAAKLYSIEQISLLHAGAKMINIVGAGMAGLLAGNMLRGRNEVVIHEAAAELPNNHSAVLRFGTDKVAEVLGVPFRNVKLIKTYLPWRNPVADCLSYSRKCSGIARSDRSITSSAFAADRWIAPPDLIEFMALGAPPIKFGSPFQFETNDEAPIISTMPMPSLMDALAYPEKPEFKYVHGANLRFQVKNCDAFVSLYVPDPKYDFNRISVTGDEVIVEFAFPDGLDMRAALGGEWRDDISIALEILGFKTDDVITETVKVTKQRYAKIAPIDDAKRKRFLGWATDKHNIYSLGRYATWRPKLLLDDLVHDIRLIERWINSEKYAVRLHR